MSVPKVKSAIEPKRLRPINLLPTIEKILEKVVGQQIIDHLRENKFLIKSQSDFRHKYNVYKIKFLDIPSSCRF